MSVREWQGPGRWTTNHAGIASSADGGQSWSRPPESVWPNRPRHDHPFQVCAFALRRDALHLPGTPNGRIGYAHLARVEPEHVADPAAYRYLAGSEWVADPFAARPVFGGPVGELAVVYHRYLGRLAMYLHERRAAVVLRSAERLDGPWSEPELLASGREYPALCGDYPHPWALDGPELYWCMSQWHPYNVFLMNSTLV